MQPILVIAYPAVGDFVRCHSLIRLLRDRHPLAPIDVVARRPAADLAVLMPEVRTVIEENFGHRRLDLAARLSLARRLRSEGYGRVHVLQNSFKSAIVPFLAGIPERIGWWAECRYPLINRPRFGRRRTTRMVDSVCLLAAPAQEPMPAQWPAPRLVIPDGLMPELTALRAGVPASVPVVALAPGSSGAWKNWPVGHFAQLAAAAASRSLEVWLVGAPWEKPLCDAIRAAAPMARDMTHPSLLRTALAIAAADAFVGNDSGPLHLAAALGGPCIGIFARTAPDMFAPINPNVRIVVADRATARGLRRGTGHPGVDEVLAALQDALKTVRKPTAAIATSA